MEVKVYVNKKRILNQEEWQVRISKWEYSGISQTKFCIEQGLNLRTFQYWRRKFKNWLNANVGKIPPKSLLGKAFLYTFEQ